MINFIRSSKNKKFIFPFHFVGKDWVDIIKFNYSILKTLLDLNINDNTFNLSDNIFYFFTMDPFYLLNRKTLSEGMKNKMWIDKGYDKISYDRAIEEYNYPIKHNQFLNMLYYSKGEYIRVITPLFCFDNIRVSISMERGFFPKVNNYDYVHSYPHIHYCYDLAKLELNLYPINKILLSGANPDSLTYPDRHRLSNLLKYIPTKIDVFKPHWTEIANQVASNGNPYSQILNKYVACFYSGVYHTDSNFVLLKIYEILGSGSLLLLEKKSKGLCDKLGLIENEHYLTIDMDGSKESIIEKINNVLDIKTSEKVYNIRKQGREFCHKNLDYNFAKNKFFSFINSL